MGFKILSAMCVWESHLKYSICVFGVILMSTIDHIRPLVFLRPTQEFRIVFGCDVRLYHPKHAYAITNINKEVIFHKMVFESRNLGPSASDSACGSTKNMSR